MKELSSAQIRQMYLDFFKSKGHDVLKSAPLIPKDDPTLLWINSGVATMKKYFDGSVVPKNHRLTSSQKSIRTNDIENVGHTARHHTLFEMLGNFSVGDYFKEEAIAWAWELLTSEKWYAMDPDRLFITVYPKDQDSKKIWKKVGVDPTHIYEAEDNFWDIGQGPSGPDSEIFYDRGQAMNNLSEDDPESYPGGENERYLEIWNIVFSEFNHKPDNTYEPLPHKNIDTGMGLERLVSVFQHAKTNFETDLFMPLIEKTAEFSNGYEYGKDATVDVSFKVIADHIRSITFAIGDGALPTNDGRGYVIRRLIRRAVMHGRKLGIEDAFLYKLVPVVGKIMQSAYPEVLEQADYIKKVVQDEENRFNETLKDGMELMGQLINETKEKGLDTISGKPVFKLYDTYGFPVELTEEFAADNDLKVDQAGFKKEMQAQKDRARAARSDAKSMGVQDALLTDIKTPSEYVGYDSLSATGVLKDIIVKGKVLNKISDGRARLIFSQTPFYAEMGGQVADTGVIKNSTGEVVAKVTDVQHAPNGQNLHTVEVRSAMVSGEEYQLEVDIKRHNKVKKNHTATHLLDQALRDVLGEHTHQAGSLVEPTYLRFDFTNMGNVTDEQLSQVEQIVNEKIWENIAVTTTVTDLESAKKMGAIALFSEKYGDVVRVVSAGDYSREFCGGNHVENTSEIGLFKIISESGIGAGTRRIEAVTAREAFEYLEGQNNLLQTIAVDLKIAKTKDVPAKVESLLDNVKQLENKVQSLEDKFASQQAENIWENVQQAGGHTVVAAQVNVSGMNQLRQLADQWKAKEISDVLILATKAGEKKVNLLTAMSANTVTKGLKAGDLIKNIAPIVGGGGGGRPDLAQAGGKKPAGISEALKQGVQWIAEQER
ncbi:alanine--tRNA ligase [Ligilactobacillus pobuzihii]|uniref:Alanine--tRNA ligase n=1 Tax=Ligilactobacillus pobuzihii TaxID=449659 RepID=A0A0R2L3Q1_9LACO|nr:alanine--tRNA ligase [Ligilactobacillus pobuzihii]KRK10029.1 alanyl-tRNA synthetase [Ligilactobacillus pobuzihii E100301 = KCTC 13174]KRN96254.1 alanyl-tRNA synthetase [Ligilactobacillus pobuzihii]GEN48450.1 alanine--tRNA ligase [Ligilactobacillus pobuzihii]